MVYNMDPRLVALIDFCKKFSNWRDQLQAAPYYIKIKTLGDYSLLKYDMYNSDLSLPIVQACRGLIIDDTTGDWSKKIVCCSFMKFFNQGERKYLGLSTEGETILGDDISYHINMEQPHEIQEKLDGSMMRLWFHKGTWHLSTSGNIDAVNAELGLTNRTFASLFWSVLEEYYPNREVLGTLNKNWCYTFELVSKDNKIVVNYEQPKLYLIHVMDLTTLQEVKIDIVPELRMLKFDRPTIYPDGFLKELNSLENFEGCVIMQEDSEGVLQRVKLKAIKYLELFHFLDEGASSKNLMRAIIDGSIDDILSYYPDYQTKVEELKSWLDTKVEDLDRILSSVDYGIDKKEFAIMHREKIQFGHLMKKYLNRQYSAKDFFYNIDNFHKVWRMYREELSMEE